MSKRRIFLLAAGLLAPATALTVPDGPVSAAPRCTTIVKHRYNTWTTQWVPATSSGSKTCELGRGDRSPAVTRLQIVLNRCYPYTVDLALGPAQGQRLAEDGIFGPLTQKALTAVQDVIGTKPDGWYGPKTRNALWFPASDDQCLPYIP